MKSKRIGHLFPSIFQSNNKKNDSKGGKLVTGNWNALAKAIQSNTIHYAFKSYCCVVFITWWDSQNNVSVALRPFVVSTALAHFHGNRSSGLGPSRAYFCGPASLGSAQLCWAGEGDLEWGSECPGQNTSSTDPKPAARISHLKKSEERFTAF